MSAVEGESTTKKCLGCNSVSDGQLFDRRSSSEARREEGGRVNLVIEIPGLHTVSEANQREHFMTKARRKREHTDTARAHVLSRMSAGWAMHNALRKALRDGARIQITLTRIGARRLDADNLAGSAKGVQDGIALALGIDDGDPRMTWLYQQEIRRKERGVQPYGVRIEIVTVEP